jgi:hypothetical protein
VSVSTVTRCAPSRATSPDSLLRLVTKTTQEAVPGSSGRTWRTLEALSRTISIRRSATSDR